MTRLAERFWDAMSYAGGILIALLFLFLGFSFWQYLPRLDGWLVPVIHFSKVTNISRDAQGGVYPTGRACFTMHMTKTGSAVPITYRFRVQTWLSPDIGVSAYIAKPDGTRDVQRYETHPVGKEWARRYCFEMPGTIADADEVTVTGSAFHRRHPFWDTETPTPTFIVGAP